MNLPDDLRPRKRSPLFRRVFMCGGHGIGIGFVAWSFDSEAFPPPFPRDPDTEDQRTFLGGDQP